MPYNLTAAQHTVLTPQRSFAFHPFAPLMASKEFTTNTSFVSPGGPPMNQSATYKETKEQEPHVMKTDNRWDAVSQTEEAGKNGLSNRKSIEYAHEEDDATGSKEAKVADELGLQTDQNQRNEFYSFYQKDAENVRAPSKNVLPEISKMFVQHFGLVDEATSATRNQWSCTTCQRRLPCVVHPVCCYPDLTCALACCGLNTQQQQFKNKNLHRQYIRMKRWTPQALKAKATFFSAREPKQAKVPEMREKDYETEAAWQTYYDQNQYDQIYYDQGYYDHATARPSPYPTPTEGGIESHSVSQDVNHDQKQREAAEKETAEEKSLQKPFVKLPLSGLRKVPSAVKQMAEKSSTGQAFKESDSFSKIYPRGESISFRPAPANAPAGFATFSSTTYAGPPAKIPHNGAQIGSQTSLPTRFDKPIPIDSKLLRPTFKDSAAYMAFREKSLDSHLDDATAQEFEELTLRKPRFPMRIMPLHFHRAASVGANYKIPLEHVRPRVDTGLHDLKVSPLKLKESTSQPPYSRRHHELAIGGVPKTKTTAGQKEVAKPLLPTKPVAKKVSREADVLVSSKQEQQLTSMRDKTEMAESAITTKEAPESLTEKEVHRTTSGTERAPKVPSLPLLETLPKGPDSSLPTTYASRYSSLMSLETPTSATEESKKTVTPRRPHSPQFSKVQSIPATKKMATQKATSSRAIKKAASAKPKPKSGSRQK